MSQAAFGGFYRIEQLILTTTPHARSAYTAQSGLPAIVTDENIRLLFSMQVALPARASMLLLPRSHC